MSGKPTLPPMEQQAGDVLATLIEYVSQSLAIPRILLGVVVSHNSGPPPTITATVHGQVIPSIRYVGTAPVVGRVVVVIADGPFYISLGMLTT